MIDREKVIKDAEEAIDILAKVEEPTFWLDFVRFAFENTLSLLKAQEPRVLTLEEVLNTGNAFVVCEFRYGMEVSRHSPKVVKYWANGIKYKYGKNWRCWTVWPTDEQREAAPWAE